MSGDAGVKASASEVRAAKVFATLADAKIRPRQPINAARGKSA